MVMVDDSGGSITISTIKEPQSRPRGSPPPCCSPHGGMDVGFFKIFGSGSSGGSRSLSFSGGRGILRTSFSGRRRHGNMLLALSLAMSSTRSGERLFLSIFPYILQWTVEGVRWRCSVLQSTDDEHVTACACRDEEVVGRDPSQ